MNREFSLVSILRTLLRWKKPIFLLTLSSGIIAALFSLFVMEESFLSFSTFSPTNQSLTDRSTMFNVDNMGAEVNYFGEKEDVNRCLTIANSSPVINAVIEQYNLVEHYEIDTQSKYWRTKVRKKFDKCYEAIKTENDAVEISLYDTDPALAAEIVNNIVQRVDELNKFHVNENKIRSIDLFKKQNEEQNVKVMAFVDSLAALASAYKIKVIGTGEKAEVTGNDFRGVEQYKTLMEEHENAVKELNNRKNICEQLELSLKNNVTSLMVVERAFAADRREKPVRSLVVLTTMLITFFCSLLGVILIEEIAEIRKQL